ncbi:MAG TPA: choice-of-anchor D domain-containing protein, partial [Solirubrobacteraceae bacterium]|nr:choice-of-anchor D domain-containing protein [Solirubrobacteraceae bacterium]
MSAAPASAGSLTVTESFSSTGSEQSFTVPAGVTSVRVRAIGAAGEQGIGEGLFASPAPGGAGALVVGQLPVTPGETLYVEVASGSSGGGAFGGEGGGSGGGASDVRTISSSSEGSLESRLLAAAGGGGGGGTFEEGGGGRGGDAGAPGGEGIEGQAGCHCGEGVTSSAGGSAGTLTGGGAGGERCMETGPWSGMEGILGEGGFGGEAFNAPNTGGGGGGGGYWGGGGGEGSCPFGGPEDEIGGGGGGGGSSYVTEEATLASFGLASRSTVPSVSISYATAATATPDTTEVVFPETQPLSTVSAPETITLTNEGGNPLTISEELFAGSTPALSTDHPEDFLIGSSSCLSALAFEASCKLTVRFAPQGPGTRTATLQIAGNMGDGPTIIALNGTGGVLPQGPKGETGATGATGPQGQTGPAGQQGETGVTGSAGVAGSTGLRGEVGSDGAQGTVGPTGATGSQGPVGPKGERGPRGLTATYVCHPRKRHGKYKEACFVSLSSTGKSAAKAT